MIQQFFACGGQTHVENHSKGRSTYSAEAALFHIVRMTVCPTGGIVKTDEELRSDALAEFKWNPRIKSNQIGVMVKDGAVTIVDNLRVR